MYSYMCLYQNIEICIYIYIYSNIYIHIVLYNIQAGLSCDISSKKYRNLQRTCAFGSMIDVMLLMMRTVCTVYKHAHTHTFKFGFKTCLDADVLCKRDEKERNYNLERFASSEENLGQQGLCHMLGLATQ